ITVMIFLLFFNLQTPLFKNSKFSVYFLKFGNISTKYLPKEWTNPIKESYNDYKKYVEAIRNPPKIEEILKELQ
ncbi:MAG: hypothetical protein SV062_04025, partial [Thermodesulfobacteriota bacterium]|nr:hypothetical protein [Thermodesulfobacteriota bacterium]